MTAPTATQWNNLFQAYAICTLFLLVKVWVSNMIAADKKKSHLPEDKMLDVGLANPPEDKWARYKGVCSNDLENIPIQLVSFWAAFVVLQYLNISGNGRYETQALTVLFVAYTGLRFCHSLCYYWALQPFRSLSYMLSTFCAMGSACVLVASAVQIDAAKVFGAPSS